MLACLLASSFLASALVACGSPATGPGISTAPVPGTDSTAIPTDSTATPADTRSGTGPSDTRAGADTATEPTHTGASPTDTATATHLADTGSGSTHTGARRTDSGASATDTGTGTPPCAYPIEVLDPRGLPSGFVLCEDGGYDRVSYDVTCDPWVPPDCDVSPSDTGLGWDDCFTDADCEDYPGGTCARGEGIYGGCGCVYQCATDSDCPSGEVCLCGGSLPGGSSTSQCIEANCFTQDSCRSSRCGAAWNSDGCSEGWVLGCRGGTDDCITPADCEGETYDDYCMYVEEGDTGWNSEPGFRCTQPRFWCAR